MKLLSQPQLLTIDEIGYIPIDRPGDSVIASAILARLLHHSITVDIRGESYRLKEKLKAGLLKFRLDNVAMNRNNVATKESYDNCRCKRAEKQAKRIPSESKSR